MSPQECPVIELRQYTLHPGARERLIDLFEREFVDTQEAVGLTVIGQFRDLDDADRFVWLRGFDSMDARPRALTAFYGGPVWRAHREEANATLIDSDDVLLLRPAWPGAGLVTRAEQRESPAPPTSLIDLRVIPLRGPAEAALLAWCRAQLLPQWAAAGASRLACYVTEPAANNFPPLPVRDKESVLVVLASFDSPPGQEIDWTPLERWQLAAPTRLRLAPTAGSALQGEAR